MESGCGCCRPVIKEKHNFSYLKIRGNKNMRFMKDIIADYKAIRDQDPAFRGGMLGFLEIIFCYPGFHALLVHKLNHFMYQKLKLRILPRLISLIVRWITGIEIHPGAKIAGGVFIDHGMGIVIGETATVGQGVTIYQGVTLGATGNEKSFQRHPTIGDGTIIGSGARVLGNITVGANSKIGANSVVLKNIPPNSTVVGIPAKIVKINGMKTVSLQEPNQDLLNKINKLQKEIEILKDQLKMIEKTEEIFDGKVVI